MHLPECLQPEIVLRSTVLANGNVLPHHLVVARIVSRHLRNGKIPLAWFQGSVRRPDDPPLANLSSQHQKIDAYTSGQWFSHVLIRSHVYIHRWYRPDFAAAPVRIFTIGAHVCGIMSTNHKANDSVLGRSEPLLSWPGTQNHRYLGLPTLPDDITQVVVKDAHVVARKD